MRQVWPKEVKYLAHSSHGQGVVESGLQYNVFGLKIHPIMLTPSYPLPVPSGPGAAFVGFQRRDIIMAFLEYRR